MLGREPENEEVVLNSPYQDRRALVEAFVTSDEFARKNGITTRSFDNLFPVFPAVNGATRSYINERDDPVRDWSVALALQTIKRENVPGAIAELGVFRGEMAVFYHHFLPERRLYLFDTFEGFPDRDLEHGEDDRFRDTSAEFVRSRFPDDALVVIRKGYFPETAKGLESEKFCFVMLDPDLYEPTLSGLEFFYDRIWPGGYIVAHDYTSGESDRAVSRAFNKFLADKPEKVIEVPDRWGSVMFRKV